MSAHAAMSSPSPSVPVLTALAPVQAPSPPAATKRPASTDRTAGVNSSSVGQRPRHTAQRTPAPCGAGLVAGPAAATAELLDGLCRRAAARAWIRSRSHARIASAAPCRSEGTRGGGQPNAGDSVSECVPGRARVHGEGGDSRGDVALSQQLSWPSSAERVGQGVGCAREESAYPADLRTHGRRVAGVGALCLRE